MGGEAGRFPGDLRTGTRIAGYELEERIGTGGTAVVFRARDDRLNRQVALKILLHSLEADETFRHRFLRESRAAAAISSRQIPASLGVHGPGESTIASGLSAMASATEIRSLRRTSHCAPRSPK